MADWNEPLIPPPIISLRGIVNRFGKQVVHYGVDLDIKRGEVMGIVGGSGTGKSVLLNTILGLKQPDGGKVELFGKDVHDPAAEAGIERPPLLRLGGEYRSA